MAFQELVKRVVQSVTPTHARGEGSRGVYHTFLPTGAGAKGAVSDTVTAKTGAVTWQFGVVSQVLAAVDNKVERWLEGLIVSQPNTANASWAIAVTTAAAIAASADVLGEVPLQMLAATSDYVVPFPQRIFIPAGKAIGLACQCSATGGKTLHAWVLTSLAK